MTLDELLRSRSNPIVEKLQNKTEFRGETTYTIQEADLRDVAKSVETIFRSITCSTLPASTISAKSRDSKFCFTCYRCRMGSTCQKVKLSEEADGIETVSDIWPTANWHEREIYDMMGIKFRGHPDLRRILMWDGYPFFPLQKDFPLAGLPSDMPDVAFTKVTPLEGGPLVTVPRYCTCCRRPRDCARHAS